MNSLTSSITNNQKLELSKYELASELHKINSISHEHAYEIGPDVSINFTWHVYFP